MAIQKYFLRYRLYISVKLNKIIKQNKVKQSKAATHIILSTVRPRIATVIAVTTVMPNLVLAAPMTVAVKPTSSEPAVTAPVADAALAEVVISPSKPSAISNDALPNP